MQTTLPGVEQETAPFAQLPEVLLELEDEPELPKLEPEPVPLLGPLDGAIAAAEDGAA